MNTKPSEWLKYVKMHVGNGVPMTKLAEKYNFDVSKLKYKVKFISCMEISHTFCL